MTLKINLAGNDAHFIDETGSASNTQTPDSPLLDSKHLRSPQSEAGPLGKLLTTHQRPKINTAENSPTSLELSATRIGAVNLGHTLFMNHQVNAAKTKQDAALQGDTSIGAEKEAINSWRIPADNGEMLTKIARSAAGFVHFKRALAQAMTAITKHEEAEIEITLTGPLRDAYFNAGKQAHNVWAREQVESLLKTYAASIRNSPGMKDIKITLTPLLQAEEQARENVDFLSLKADNYASMKAGAQAANLPWSDDGTKLVLSVGGSSTQALGHESAIGLTAKIGARDYRSTEENYAKMTEFVANVVNTARTQGTGVIWATNSWSYALKGGDHYVFNSGKSCELSDEFSVDFQKALDKKLADGGPEIKVLLMSGKKYPIEGSHARTSAKKLAKIHDKKQTYLIELSSGQIKLLQMNEEGEPEIKSGTKYKIDHGLVATSLINGTTGVDVPAV